VDTEVKNEARKTGEAALTEFITRYLLWDPVTDADRLAVGLHPHDKTQTPLGRPVDLVDFWFESIPESHKVIIHFRIKGKKTKGKGKYHGAELCIWVLPFNAPPPVTADHPGSRSEVCTDSPWTHTFGEDELGMRLYIAMRWENPSVKDQAGSKGDWSGIQSIVIA
jgi:hypothetical protein